ncbi:dehydration-responsive element-binding protein 1B-like isoform X2 [Telopea speciosissima]|uniref:dehydration-responsive element-binding protein 1B-like isoform X2 n=1 Tax=Telopea speciosissima TaxID=54955 RepID=UPI001CC6EB75|nr:dehydration-responsive element-binding protein 1B-like isoform X2 [Telopea speciosissima]
MEIFSLWSSNSLSLDPPGTPSKSYSNTTIARPGPATSSDEEFLLASSLPKRRAGRKKFRETRHPIYRGVRRRNSDRWVCEVREPKKKSRIWLGTFPTAEMAARAHDVAAMALRGRSACLNFADSASRLRLPETADAKDIQRAAAKAAESFRPAETREEMCCNETRVKKNETTSPTTLFLMDEEEEDYGMPRLLEDMALLSPTHLEGGFYWDDVEFDADMALWSHSI